MKGEISMLVACPECELQVSDKAVMCPHCGYPLKISAARAQKRPYKHRRLPNGFGQISEIKNRNLRKPFRAMVTVGKNEYGRPICKPLKPESYFETYNDAYAALVEYNKDPYELASNITLEELYERWSKEYLETVISESTKRNTTSMWAYCSPLYKISVKAIRARHIKDCIMNAKVVRNGKTIKASPSVQLGMKALFNKMFDYALEYELIDRNYARDLKISSDLQKEREEGENAHIAFTDEELDILWKNINMPYVDLMIIQCYSGWRPRELGLLKLDNVDFSNWTFKGGMKTFAGKNRIVPIHSKIRPLVLKRFKEAKELNSEYLFNYTKSKYDTQLNYDRYKNEFSRICNQLNINQKHRPHDGRKTFVTLCKKYQVDEYAIKYMVGHSITDITENVYTERSIEWFEQEIEKIK